MPAAHKQLAFGAASVMNTGFLRTVSPLPLLCPYHHVVSSEPIPYIDPLYAYKDTRAFERDLDYLLRHFEPVTLREVAEGRHLLLPRGRKAFLVCFDDGFRQVMDTVAPLLVRKGVPAALFVNPDFIDNRHLFYAVQKGYLLHRISRKAPSPGVVKEASTLFGRSLSDPSALARAIRGIDYRRRQLVDPLSVLLDVDWSAFVRTYRPFLTMNEAHSWVQQGFGIGAHSMDHPLYTSLSLEEQVAQTLDSTAWVRERLNPGYTAFAFPHVDTGVGNAFFEHTQAIDVIFGNSTGRLERHPHVVHRFIGENPRVPMEKMVKAVLAYSALAGSRPVKRP